jgi:dihydrofolate reductase
MDVERKVIAYLAASADGFIARKNGSVDWLNRRPDTIDYGMVAFRKSIDTIVMGRGTYDWAVNYFKKLKMKPQFDAGVTNYVFSRNPPKRPTVGVEFVNEPVKKIARRLRSQPGKNIWMMGGGGLIASFLDADELDEFDIQVIPTLIGEGISMIAPKRRDIEMRLISSKKFSDGVVRLRYAVLR